MSTRRPKAGRRPVRPSVLIAPAYLEPLRSLLSDMGWAIDVAETASAVCRAVPGPARVLVLGADLPDGDGFELCESIKRDHGPAAPSVIMVTGQSDSDGQLRAFKAGADEILTMPISRYQLVLRIRAQLRVKELAARLAAD